MLESVSNETWMALWLAATRARLEVLARRAAGLAIEDAQETAQAIEEDIEQRRPAATEVPAAWLRTRLALTDTEERVVWLLASFELSPEVRAMVAGLGLHGFDPSGELLQRVVYGPLPTLRGSKELAARGALARLALLVRTDGGDGTTPDHRRTYRVAERVRNLVLGDDSLDDDLRAFAGIPAIVRPLAEVVVSDGASERAVRAITRKDALVLALGAPGSGRSTLLRAAAAEAGQRIIDVDAAALPAEAAAYGHALHALVRECRLLGLTPLVRNIDRLSTEQLHALDRVLGAAHADPVLATACVKPPGFRSQRAVLTVELEPLTSRQRATLWRRAIPAASPSDGDLLATNYPLAPAVIAAAGEALRARTSAMPTPEQVIDSIFAVTDDRLAGLATRLKVTQTWDDLVLPDEQVGTIIELLARVRERRRVYEDWGFAKKLGRGLGVSALLSGPPGTGKTMVATLIAKDLGLPVYQVDLAQMVSKWIGETEKNLAALFDAAESSCAILLFDEADSLFGKRTEVKSSNDRYANLEVNFLLQRIERFTGICLLTTNHENAIDEAFRRRLAFHVRFPVPEDTERTQLWRALVPPAAPIAPGVDFERLGRELEMSGGYIRNAVLRAAFMAASANTTLDMEHLWHAGVLEYESIGKVVARGT